MGAAAVVMREREKVCNENDMFSMCVCLECAFDRSL